MPDFDTCSVNDINKLQSLLLTRLSNYRNNNEITAISTWLFLGPFKIILGNQERLWNVNGINAITLPTGLEVNKGIIKLKKLNYDFMEDFDLSWLDEVTSKNEDPLLNNYATSKMVHAHLVKIANITDVPVLYINNALHLYGRGDI